MFRLAHRNRLFSKRRLKLYLTLILGALFIWKYLIPQDQEQTIIQDFIRVGESQRWRSDDFLSLPKANASHLDVLTQQLVGNAHWDWIRQRIERLWPDFAAATINVTAEFFRRHGRSLSIKNILIVPGMITKTNFADPAVINAGGPVGELMQWADLMAGLHALGHTLHVRTNLHKVSIWLRVSKDDSISLGQSGYCLGTDVDIIFTDIVGFWSLAEDVRQAYKGKIRILDDYGTEAMFNDPEYAENVMHVGKDYSWGKLALNLKQFYTLYPHTADNSFLGFVVPRVVSIRKKEPIALLYGKDSAYLENMHQVLKTISKYITVKTTMPKVPSDIAWMGRIQNTGVLSPTEYANLLGKTKLFVGLGDPVEGVGIMTALASGAVILNPRRKGAKQKLAGKPTTRLFHSQTPYLEQFVGPPHVFTVDYDNETELTAVIKHALNMSDVQPLLPHEFTVSGFLERVAEYIEHQDFCGQQNMSSVWPPYSELRLTVVKQMSCNDACYSRGLVCEPAYFPIINDQQILERETGVKCTSIDRRADPRHPSVDKETRTCHLQARDTLFSCASHGNSDTVTRLCPCRAYMPYQIALPLPAV